MKTLNESLQSQQSAKPDCHVWDVNLEAVLYELMVDKVEAVHLELAGKPDGNGQVALVVRKCQCDICLNRDEIDSPPSLE